MTSPTQLKYLDAIGIPVWVSRDLVAETLVEVVDVDNVAGSNDTATIKKSTAGSSVESILQDLDKQADPAINQPATAPRVHENPERRPVDTSAPAANEIARTASHIVYASGSLQADWMVIGESPDMNDDRMNQPYAGELGVLLNNMLRAVGLENPQQSAYQVNIIKASMHAVDPVAMVELNQMLSDKIKQIKPKIILVVGQLAAQNLLQSKEPLVRLRGKVQKHPETETNLIVTYYPSYLLSKPMDKRKAWDDLKLAMRTIQPT